MAKIDVSELMSDPDFVDSFNVIRTTASTDDNGNIVKVEQVLPASGVVQPASGQAFNLLADAARASGAIEIWSIFPFGLVTPDRYPDQVDWQGNRYILIQLNEYRNWGVGYSYGIFGLLAVTDSGQDSEI